MEGKKPILIRYDPETVSDERLRAVLEVLRPLGIVKTMPFEKPNPIVGGWLFDGLWLKPTKEDYDYVAAAAGRAWKERGFIYNSDLGLHVKPKGSTSPAELNALQEIHATTPTTKPPQDKPPTETQP